MAKFEEQEEDYDEMTKESTMKRTTNLRLKRT
jgi:hypothetical protein